MQDIGISKQTIEFLENNQDLINSNRFQELYDLYVKHFVTNIFSKYYTPSTNQITYLLLKAHMPHLEFMNAIPEGYALSLDLDRIVIPAGITAIKSQAFVDNPYVKYIEFTETTSRIDKNAFSSFLTNDVIVNFIGDINNYVTTKNIMQLVWSTTHIMNNGSNIESLYINTAKNIQEHAFFYQKVKELRLGTSIKSIGRDAFNHCKQLHKIVYDGTVEQFNLIRLGLNAFSDVDTEFIECLDGKVQLEEI